MLTQINDIRSIIFDLDGTLYHAPGIAQEIERGAEELVAESRGLSIGQARSLLRCARQRLSELHDEEPTLTRTCMELGIEIRDFHLGLQRRVRPERHLGNDPILFALLDSLRDNFDLYLYTNNNLQLTRKILALLGVDELFTRLYTIEFTWVPKPDRASLLRMLEDIGGPPESFLCVGDRQQVDLNVAASLGIPTLLVRDTSDLLQIHKMIGIIP